MVGRLFAAEWLKLRKRPLAWALLAIFLGLLVLYLGLWALVIALQEGALTRGTVRFEVLSAAQAAQIKRQLSFPGVFGTVLGQLNSVGGILAVILAGGALGSDFGWGTLRILLIRAPSRGGYLLAKLLAVMLAVLCGALAGLATGSLVALAASTALGLPSRLQLGDLAALGIGLVRGLYVILPYVLATFVCAAFGRSVLAGVGGGLIFLALDIGAGSLSSLGLVSDIVLALLNLLLQPNINRLVVQNAESFGLDPTVLASGLDLATLPSPLHAALVVAAYCVLFGYSAWRALAGSDVSGAT